MESGADPAAAEVPGGAVDAASVNPDVGLVEPLASEVRSTLLGCGTVLAMVCGAAFGAIVGVVLSVVGLVMGQAWVAGFGVGVATTGVLVCVLLFWSSASAAEESWGSLFGPSSDAATAVVLDRAFAWPFLLIAAVAAGFIAVSLTRVAGGLVSSGAVWQASLGAAAAPLALALYAAWRCARWLRNC